MHTVTTLQLYFQQIRPLAKCDSEDGRVVGHLLMNLVDSKPKDLAHEIRQFANRTAMLRECGLRHIGDMLVAMLAALPAHPPSDSEHASCEDDAQDPASLTSEQATAMGHILAASIHGSHATSSAPRQVFVNVESILCTMKAHHAWFAPMLEVLLLLSPTTMGYAKAAESLLHSIGGSARRMSASVTSQAAASSRRMSASIAPQAAAGHAPNTNFGSWYAPSRALPHL